MKNAAMSQIKEVTALPSSTIRLLGSSQVITSVFSVVKELIENALDAEATSIDVKLEGFGLGKVEVRDNGSGIPSPNVPFIAKRYHTTKITAFSDLENLTTYGFRGEALGSLCTMCSLSVTTKTASDDISLTYSFDCQGQITGTKPSHLLQGTTISAVELFKNLPVRRNYYKTNKRKKDELKKIEDLMVAYGIICPCLRLTLRNDKDIIWQKNPVPSINEALGMLGRDVVSNLEHRELQNDESNIHIHFFLPEPYCKKNLTRSSNDRCFTFINKRPVTHKNIEKLMRQYCGCEPGRWPVYVVVIDLCPTDVDVNVEPNKTQVFMQPKEFVMESIRGVLEEVYGTVSDRKNKVNTNEEMLKKTEHHTDIETIESSKGMTDDSCGADSSSAVRIVSVNDNSQLDSRIPIYKLDRVGNISNSSSEISCTENKETEISKETVEVPSQIHVCNSIDSFKDSNNHAETKTGDIDQNDNMEAVRSQHFSVTNTEVGDSTLLAAVAGTSQYPDSDCVLTQTVSGCFDIANQDLKEVINLTDDDEKNVDSSKKEADTDKCDVIQKKKIQSPVGFEGIHADTGNDLVTELFKRWDENDPFNTMEAILSACDADNTKNGDDLDADDATLRGDQDTPINTDGITKTDKSAEEWSKGQGLKTSAGEVIQPVSLLCGGKRPLSPSVSSSNNSPAKKIKLLSSNTNMTRGESSKRNLTAFDMFSKAITPKVIREFPNKEVEYITQVIQERWISLPAGEKTQYELRAGAAGSCQIERQKKTPAKSLSKLNHKINEPTSVSIKEQLLKASVSSSKKVTEKKVDFHMNELKHTFQRKIYESQTDCSLKTLLIGPLKSCGVWVCCHGNQIKLLNPHRIQETVIFHNLMSNHVLPTQILEKHIPITQSRLGDVLWRALETIARLHQTDQVYSILSDNRLVNNGIQIQFYFDTCSGELCSKLTGLCPLIPMYGIDDIAEILDLISSTGADTVSKARPLKVLNYLQGEAVRMARQLSKDQNKEEILTMLESKSSILPDNCNTCFHGKPFFYDLYNLNDIPLIQTLS